MEPEETATIVRLVKSVFPQQPIDGATYETWHLVIGHLEFSAAHDAVVELCQSQKFCSAADIIQKIADKRCAGMPQSAACRGADCRGCQVSWCSHSCHPRAVAAIAGTPQPAKAAGRGGQPVALGDAMKAITRSP